VRNASFVRIFMCDMTHSEVTSLVDGDDIRSHVWKSHVKEHERSGHACEKSCEAVTSFVDDLDMTRSWMIWSVDDLVRG